MEEPTVPELLPACTHSSWTASDDGTWKSREEMRVQGKTLLSGDLTGSFLKSMLREEAFDKKLTETLWLLDTDYDNYLITYQCFDNIKFTVDSTNLEPVHVITVGIATRNPNESEEKLSKYLDVLMAKVPGLKKEDMARVLSGSAGHCNYRTDL
jgi:hypothetical protein